MFDLIWEANAEQVDQLPLPPMHGGSITLVGSVRLLDSEPAVRRSFDRVEMASCWPTAATTLGLFKAADAIILKRFEPK